MLQHIENAGFSSPLLMEMKEKLSIKYLNRKASECISKLDSLIGFINLRYSSIHFPVNIITLWDLQFYISLEKWKSRAGTHLRDWLIALGKYEELSSLAILLYDNPSWCFANIIDKPYHLKAVETGHPLIHHKERVANDLHLDGAGSIMLITGSNMSGKSTMLRTIGINLILSYAGAPVCAKNFECSLMNIYSSMRISDNLEKNISSFYAELIRVKMIIEAAQSGTPMIFFLDEIFRGTNTRDRKTGAITVLKKLSSDGVMGLVSTHDVELAELENDTGLNLKNSYFRETYKDNSIHFDYIMREGISDTSDAIYLMRMIGIEI
jgi:DNA mismatch repair ATPase MutS